MATRPVGYYTPGKGIVPDNPASWIWDADLQTALADSDAPPAAKRYAIHRMEKEPLFQVVGGGLRQCLLQTYLEDVLGRAMRAGEKVGFEVENVVLAGQEVHEAYRVDVELDVEVRR